MEILNEVIKPKTIIVHKNGYSMLLKIKRIKYVFESSKGTTIRTKDGEFEVEQTVLELKELMDYGFIGDAE